MFWERILEQDPLVKLKVNILVFLIMYIKIVYLHNFVDNLDEL